MKLYYEKALREQADEPMIALLNLWHALCQEKIGSSIEAMVASRKEYPRFAHVQGELHTAIPEIVQDRVVLLLLMDSVAKVELVIVSHELGHWILRLQGFETLRYKGHANSDTEIFLNSMIQHVPLYELQRSVGHDPQAEIDSRCLHNLKLWSKQKEANVRQSSVNAALMIADDVLNSSAHNRTALMNVLRKKHPNTFRLVKAIIKEARTCDLMTPEHNLAFAYKVVRCLDLPGEWCAANDVGALISMHQRLQDDGPGSDSQGSSD